MAWHEVAGSQLSVFWKKWPAIDRLEDVWRQSLTAGRGMDTTSVALKLCVGEQFTSRSLGKELFIAGYVNGSTRGAAVTLLTYMLTQCKRRPFDLPEVQAFLLSASRLKATFVVYKNSKLRARDAWRAAPSQVVVG